MLAGHAHNYQRFTRHRPDGTDIPYIVCGNGGHNVQPLQAPNLPVLRTPQVLQLATPGDDAVTFENYDDMDYGYLRIIADAAQLRIEYHPASDGAGAKTPDDSVTIYLKTRQQTRYTPNDLGMPRRAQAVQQLLGSVSFQPSRVKRRGR